MIGGGILLHLNWVGRALFEHVIERIDSIGIIEKHVSAVYIIIRISIHATDAVTRNSALR